MSTAARAAFAALFLAFVSMPAHVDAAATRDVMQKAGEIVYITGGVGEEERAVLKGMEKQFNLKLVFARKDGAFVSDVAVTIKTPDGKVILADQAQGPIFMAKLPPGSYIVEAAFEGATSTRKVNVGKGLETVQFAFPEPGVGATR